jgi:cell division transport system ATP-binding protein
VLIATHDEDLVARANRPTLHLENGRLVDVADTSPEPDYDRGYDDEDDAEDEA